MTVRMPPSHPARGFDAPCGQTPRGSTPTFGPPEPGGASWP
uniref:Uncharacterized protein n=1 Tax=Human herpesvirus 2 TaxID=10310 RepID=A0A481TPR5_HHV2|nr:hypothetical protein [Human alphaherpesvirus 2]